MRSTLFVPEDSTRKFKKESEGDADALIIDIGNSVVTEKKEEARGLTLAIPRGYRGTDQLYIRVNALHTGMTLADFASVMPDHLDGIVLPESSGGDDVRQLATWREAFEAAAEAEITPIGTVYTETKNVSVLQREPRAPQRDGFSTKAVIHPTHIDIVDNASEPTEAEKIWGQNVVKALADNPNSSTLRLNGMMIDKPHLGAAERISNGYRSTNILKPEATIR